jgi:hemoglobin/transferrin/lactoferrin receptor protein
MKYKLLSLTLSSEHGSVYRRGREIARCALKPQRRLALVPWALLAVMAASPAHAQTTTALPAAPITPPLPKAAVARGELAPLVVSGSRSEQAADTLPASIDVIDTQAMERAQVQDIRDALQDLPNVSVRRAPARFAPIGGASTGRDGNSGINIRGLEGNRVLLLVDGVRTPRSYSFGANAFGRDYFSTDLLQRIEVVRGPASVLYGSDGIAGLVNFITLTPDDLLLRGGQTRRFGARVSLGTSGDDSGRQASATLAGQASDTLQWMLSATTGRSEGLDNQGNNDSANVNRTKPNPQTDRRAGLLGKLVWRPNASQQHTLSVEAIQKEGDIELLSSRAVVLNATATLRAASEQEMERERLSWQGRWNIAQPWADRLDTLLSYQQASARDLTLNDRNTAADQIRDMRYDESAWQLGVQATRTWGLSQLWGNKLTYGLDLTRGEVNNLLTGLTPAAGETFHIKRFPDTVESTQGLYVQSEFFSDHMSLTPGLRLERFELHASQSGFSPPSILQAKSLNGSAITPKLGAVWRFDPAWSLFGNLASGFKAPNAAQVNAYFENFGPFAFYRTIPNPNLKPEKSRNLELGVRGQSGPVALEVAAFTGRYKDLIEDNATVGGAGTVGDPTIFQSINIAQARISGLELKGQWQISGSPTAGWSLPFAFGLTRGTNSTNGRPLNSVDPAKLLLGLQRTSGELDLRLDLTRHSAKSAEDIDSAALVTPPATQFSTPQATTLDISAQWRVRPGLRLNLAVVNLTDRSYWRWADVRGLASNSAIASAFTQPGRHVNVSLVADF